MAGIYGPPLAPSGSETGVDLHPDHHRHAHAPATSGQSGRCARSSPPPDPDDLAAAPQPLGGAGCRSTADRRRGGRPAPTQHQPGRPAGRLHRAGRIRQPAGGCDRQRRTRGRAERQRESEAPGCAAGALRGGRGCRAPRPALARMDSDDLRERLGELRAQLASAEAQLARSRSELDRNERLYRQNAISQSDFDRVRSIFLVDEAAVKAARQRLEARQVEQADLIVRAPFDGVVSQRFADPGAFVTPTTTAAAVAGATSSSIVELAQGLEAVAKVPESDIGRIRLGQDAEVRVDAFPDRRFPARVKRITPRAVKLNNVTSFDVVLAFLKPEPQLRIGMTADIGFQTGRVQADTLVPTVAIVTEEGRPGVLLVGRDNQPTFQPVELGVSGGRNTQILSGVKAGTRIFIDMPPWAKRKRS
ncbi:efflux RND transporter periplasmic adaptor subunit [Synechococcus sp. GFB01]|uniref:efflux RND transporter periplasmic adaptor subunit n=1 Tax=Synechococcus sp. GFB01 TaxID=1662190 RepID=UPI001F27F409|nr:efflux RND transporter periplasmic adaptor subunit [Synechococcus sp. GFB01]